MKETDVEDREPEGTLEEYQKFIEGPIWRDIVYELKARRIDLVTRLIMSEEGGEKIRGALSEIELLEDYPTTAMNLLKYKEESNKKENKEE